MKLVFLDIETNGLDMESHIPLDISFIITSGDCTQIECEYSSLIKPLCYNESEFYSKSTDEALKVNGIIYNMLVDQGKLPTLVRFEIEDLFVKHRVFHGEAIFICQNPSFDRAFINKLFWQENMKELKWPYHWLDLASMYWIKMLVPQKIKGRTVRYHPNIRRHPLSKDSIALSLGLPEEEKPHRALNGVKHLISCYQALINI